MSTLPVDQEEFGKKHGYSPLAHRRVFIDFDGTLVEWGPLMGPKTLLPGALSVLREFRRLGYDIWIFTSRMSPTWARYVVGPDGDPGAFLANQEAYVRDIVAQAGVEIAGVTAEKIPAELYIDDRALRFEGDWLRTAEELWPRF